MRRRDRYVLFVALLLCALAVPAIASSETLPVEAMTEGSYGYGSRHYWSNPQQTIAVGEEVTFHNKSTEVPHGLDFTSGGVSAATICAGLPAKATTAAGETNWTAKCVFSKPGTYSFVCTVHAEMTGTVVVTNGEPVVTTEAAAPVGDSEATLNGSVDPEGKETTYHFKWGTTEAYGNTTTPTSAGKGSTAVPAPAALSGLQAGTTYHYRLVASNEKGVSEGADRTFQTLTPPGPPTASTGSASVLGPTEATLNGSVDPNGQATSYYFKWGTSSGYGQTTALTAVGEGRLGDPAAATLTGLLPDTTYHYQLVAENGSGTVPGSDREFTTATQPAKEPAPSPQPTPQPGPPSPEPLVPLVTPPTPSGPLGAAPSAGGLRLSGHGSTVRGSLRLAASAAGARLEVELLAKPAALGARGSRPVVVGRFARSGLPAGTVSFAVSLTPRARSALRRRHRLALSAKLTLTSASGVATRLAGTLTLRA